MTAPLAPVVRTVALRKVFGTLVAVDGLDLEIGRGEVFGMLGPNGSGQDDLHSYVVRAVAADERIGDGRGLRC